MTLDDDDVLESSDFAYLLSFFTYLIDEFLLPRSTHSYATELVIESLYLVGECDELLPSFSVWCISLGTVVC